MITKLKSVHYSTPELTTIVSGDNHFGFHPVRIYDDISTEVDIKYRKMSSKVSRLVWSSTVTHCELELRDYSCGLFVYLLNDKRVNI